MSKGRGIVRLSAALLSATVACSAMGVTALGSQGNGADGGWYAPKERSAAHYDQREYEGTDLTRLEELLDQLETSCQEEQASQISDLYDQILKEMDWLATQTALADILYSAALDDEQLSDQYEEASQNAQEAMEMILSSFQNAMKMPGGEALEEAMGPEIAWAVETYEPATERLSSLLDQEMELMLQYNQVRAQPLTVEVEGEEWDYQTLDEADIDYAEYSRICGELAKENNRRLGEIYLELVQVRGQIAQECGYDNYSDYAYDVLYGRDFTPDDMKELYGSIKDNALYLMEDCWYAWYSDLSNEISQDNEEIMDLAQSCMEDMDPELGEAFSHMRGLGLYDMDWPGENEDRSGSYTIDLPYYGDAFVFLTKENGYQDFFSLVHEFGHFAGAYGETTPWLYQFSYTDVCEIQSQGLELLMLHYQDDLFGDLAGDAQIERVGNAVDSIVVGAMLDEFETSVYEQPDLTLEELNRLFGDLNSQYDQWYFTNEDDGQCYGWVEVGHLFQNPLYYVSYAVSAYPALQLWLDSRTDWQGAVDCYMELSALGVSQPYQMALETCGLESIFEENAMEEMAVQVREVLELDSYDWDSGYEAQTQPSDSRFAGIAVLAAAAVLEMQAVCFAIGGVILWQVVKKRPSVTSDDDRQASGPPPGHSS